MLVGGAFGVLLRTLVDGPSGSSVPDRSKSRRWRPLALGMLGAFILGGLTGAALISAGDSAGAALGVGLSGALLTFCLFGSAATELMRRGPSRQTVLATLTHAGSALAAATVGVALGALVIG